MKLVINWLLNVLFGTLDRHDDPANLEPLEVQIRRAITKPLEKLSEVQIALLKKGEVLFVSITEPVIKNVMANGGTTEHFFYIQEIAQETGAKLKYQLELLSEVHTAGTEYFMSVNLFPDDDALDFDEPGDSDAMVELPVPEPVAVPLKAMAAGAGGRR